MILIYENHTHTTVEIVKPNNWIDLPPPPLWEADEKLLSMRRTMQCHQSKLDLQTFNPFTIAAASPAVRSVRHTNSSHIQIQIHLQYMYMCIWISVYKFGALIRRGAPQATCATIHAFTTVVSPHKYITTMNLHSVHTHTRIHLQSHPLTFSHTYTCLQHRWATD